MHLPGRGAKRTIERASTTPPFLAEVDPEFASELTQLLLRAGRSDLARLVRTLRVVEPCGCDNPACASFYVVPSHQARWLWGRGGETVALAPAHGAVSVDAVAGRILAVEVLDRSPLRSALENRLGWGDR